MSKLHALKGSIQNYAWGGGKFIPELLKVQPDNKPYAEYWLGAHDNSPALLLERKIALNALIKENPKQILGDAIANRFGRLPFLFKVLDVKEMLSIQVHPSKFEAEKGFSAENDLGIPLDAPNRNYKDDNHKPEIMVALSEFWLLHGFLPQDGLIEVLNNVPEFNLFIDLFKKGGYKGLYKTVMEYSHEETHEILKPLIDRILPLFESGKLDKSSADYWASKAYLTFCEDGKMDKGIFSIYFFNIVRVEPGEAIFQNAGIPHAYLEGQNMELMANSDNVLRGGLTPKHIDVSELLKHVEFSATHPMILKGELLSDGLERIYKCPAPDFELSQIVLKQGDAYHSSTNTATILMIIEGGAEVVEGDSTLPFSKGEACFLEANASYQIKTSSMAIVYKATAPIN